MRRSSTDMVKNRLEIQLRSPQPFSSVWYCLLKLTLALVRLGAKNSYSRRLGLGGDSCVQSSRKSKFLSKGRPTTYSLRELILVGTEGPGCCWFVSPIWGGAQ